MATLKIDIIAVGKLKERFWMDACNEYLKRLAPFASVNVKEVDDVSPDKAGTREKALELEEVGIRKKLTSNSFVVLLDQQGREHSSEQIAELVKTRLIESSIHHITFVIGGSDGLASSLLKEADERLSFGPITLPHNLARVVLLEQLYRAFKIIRNEPYHK